MYNSLKTKWNEQLSLSANQHFPKFRYYLERGGTIALDFIAKNADFVETVIGGPDKVAALEEAIAKRNTAAENQKYFMGEAKRIEGPIKSVLRTRYNALKGYCEQSGLPWSELTPETLLPATRRAAETGSWESTEMPQDPTVDDGGADDPTVDDGEADDPTVDDGEADDPTVDDGEADDPTADGNTLCRHIEELHTEGFNKTDIWAAVKGEATAIGWTRAAVWAYIDELVNVM